VFIGIRASSAVCLHYPTLIATTYPPALKTWPKEKKSSAGTDIRVLHKVRQRIGPVTRLNNWESGTPFP
jgi:hypothetical protein